MGQLPAVPSPRATTSGLRFAQLVFRGLSTTFRGLALVASTPALRRAYLLYVVAIAGLAAFCCAGLVLAIVLALAAWAPPALLYWPLLVLLVLLSGLLAPILAVVAVNLIFPLLNEKIFFAGLEHVDSTLAAQWRARPVMAWHRLARVHLRILGFALGWTVLAALLGFIPVVGAPLGVALGLYATTRTLALEMCEPLWSRSGDDLANATIFWRAHRATLLGFALPWAALASIPLLNGALFGLCQAATSLWTKECLPLGDDYVPASPSAEIA